MRRLISLLCAICGLVAAANGFCAVPVLTLEQAYDRALASDQSIRIAYWEVRKANLLPWSALTRLGPQISSGLSYVRDETTSHGRAVETASGTLNSSSVFSRTDTGRIGLNYQQPLVDLAVFPEYRYGKLSARSARLQHRYTIRGVLFGVAQAYYEVLKQEKVVGVNRETLRLAEEQLGVSKNRVELGEVTRADELRAQVAVETARRACIEGENLLLLDRNTLAQILNFKSAEEFAVTEPPGAPEGLRPFDELLTKALAEREDLKVATIAIEQEIAKRGVVLAGYAPKVVAQWNMGHDEFSGTGTDWSKDWSASISVQIPIFTGGQREIDALAATRTIEQSRLQAEQLAKQIQQELKQAWLTVRTLVQTNKALAAQVVAADQSYQDLQAQYQAGTATSLDVLSALNQLNTARRDLAVQLYGFQVALRNVEQVSGVFQQRRVESSSVP